jgi:LytS/YehU family sensor histidine kinase
MLLFLQRRWVYHTLTWCTLAILTSEANIDLDNITASLWEAVIEILVYFAPLVCCVYTVLYFKKRYLERQYYYLFAFLFIVTIALSLSLYELEYYLTGTYSNDLRQDTQNLFFASLMAIGLQHFKRGIFDQYRLKELQARNTEIELAALKTQLNPHFLFNSLNNIYGVVQEDPPKGAEMIIGLADIMRYYLRSSSRERITLEEEAQLIQSYIELEALRLHDNCILTSEIQLADESGKVAPLLLLPFIENAFKHGTHPIRPCFISINLKVQEGTIRFTIANSIIGNTRAIKTNIGLANTKKRLKLIYPNRHQLEIIEKEGTYSVCLEIPLHA